jgi:hypothetical protein
MKDANCKLHKPKFCNSGEEICDNGFPQHNPKFDPECSQVKVKD